MPNRYDTSGTVQGQYQPGSNGSVLRNILEIDDIDEMDLAEFDALAALQDILFDELAVDQEILLADLSDWHRRWLGSIYEWAGEFRSVNMGKGGFQFAAAHLIPGLMVDFEKNYLSRYTPCDNMNKDELSEALAICHVEFIIIHPYREGNGRLGRLLVTVMALQARMPALEFAVLENEKDRYIGAIHAGHSGDYASMTQIFSEILDFSLQQASVND